MNNKYSDEIKEKIIERYEKRGEAVLTISDDTGIPRSTIYVWIKKRQTAEKKSHSDVTVRNFRLLENKVKRLECMVEILKTAGCMPSDPLEVKLPILESLHSKYNVHIICEALEVPRGTFYNYIFRNKRTRTWYSKRREELREKIQQIYNDHHQIFGAAKICAVMKAEGYKISVEMVRELMRDIGLVSIRQDAKSLYEKEKQRYNNRLNQQFTVSAPNRVWVSDVTCFRFNNYTYYICVIIDLFARRVVGYKVGKNNSTQLTKSAFKSAYENRNPPDGLIFHSDRGSNYTSNAFRSCLQLFGVVQSFSRSHSPYDNSVMESFFSSMKREELYRTKYRSERDFRSAVDKYIQYYNGQRPHAKNKYKTPEEKEAEYCDNHANSK